MNSVRHRVVAVVSIAVAFFALAVAPADAANPNPIDNSVFKTFYDGGADVPLRVGQHDGGGTSGFGQRHIDDRKHRTYLTWDQFAERIDTTMDTGCQKDSGTTYVCESDGTGMRVVYNSRELSDGRPKGIITAFFTGGGCFAPQAAACP